jgi:hypothetical protein
MAAPAEVSQNGRKMPFLAATQVSTLGKRCQNGYASRLSNERREKN